MTLTIGNDRNDHYAHCCSWETGDGGFPTGINVKGRYIRKGIMHAFFYMFAMCIQIR